MITNDTNDHITLLCLFPTATQTLRLAFSCPFINLFFHPPTSVRLPLPLRVLASQKATSVPHQSEKDEQSFSVVVSHRHEG